jgi:hypothetical protein
MYNKFDNGWPIKTLLLLFPPPLPVASLFNPRFYSRVFTMAEILLTFSGEQEIGPKCNRCNRMQRPALALLCRLQHRCLLSRLSFPLEFHSLFSISSALPSFLVFCQLTASNGQQLSFIFVSLKHLHLRAYEEIIPTMSRPVIGVVLRTCEGEKRVSPCFYVKCPQQGTYNILLSFSTTMRACRCEREMSDRGGLESKFK